VGILVIFLFDDRIANRTTGAWWGRFCGYMTPIRVIVQGKEHIKNNQSYVIIANHQSSYDIFLLFGWLGIDVKWVIKKELRNIPVFGYACEKGGNILIDRSNNESARKSLNEAKKKTVKGTSIIILPEGTRSESGRLGEFKKGAFNMAFDLDLPVLPISISGTKNILPARSLSLFPGKAVMKIHHPLDIANYSRERIDHFINDARNIIEQGIENPIKN